MLLPLVVRDISVGNKALSDAFQSPFRGQKKEVMAVITHPLGKHLDLKVQRCFSLAVL